MHGFDEARAATVDAAEAAEAEAAPAAAASEPQPSPWSESSDDEYVQCFDDGLGDLDQLNQLSTYESSDDEPETSLDDSGGEVACLLQVPQPRLKKRAPPPCTLQLAFVFILWRDLTADARLARHAVAAAQLG